MVSKLNAFVVFVVVLVICHCAVAAIFSVTINDDGQIPYDVHGSYSDQIQGVDWWNGTEWESFDYFTGPSWVFEADLYDRDIANPMYLRWEFDGEGGTEYEYSQFSATAYDVQIDGDIDSAVMLWSGVSGYENRYMGAGPWAPQASSLLYDLGVDMDGYCTDTMTSLGVYIGKAIAIMFTILIIVLAVRWIKRGVRSDSGSGSSTDSHPGYHGPDGELHDGYGTVVPKDQEEGWLKRSGGYGRYSD
jgi:hypothetical protein